MKLATVMGAGWLPYAVSLETGLRIGDVVSLRWSQVHDDTTGARIEYTAAKTGKAGVSTVSRHLADALARIRKERRIDDIEGRQNNYIFLGRSPDTHITRQALWARIKAAARIADIDLDGCSPHSMRKVYAVDVAHERGIRAAQEQLQHTHISDTEIYALSDWTSGDNAELPLVRGDMRRIVDEIIDLLGLRG